MRIAVTALGAICLFCALLALLWRPLPPAYPLGAILAILVVFRALQARKPRRKKGLSAETIGSIALFMMGSLLGLSVLAAGSWMLANTLPKPLGIYASHPDYIWTLAPNTTDVRAMQLTEEDKRVWDIAISSQGIRDREVADKKDNEFRILLLGDSFAMGWGLESDETISAQLEQALNERISDRKITVLNAGVIGYAPWQERGFLNERGFALEPDLVVAQLFPGNDIEGSLEAQQKNLRAYDAAWKRNFYGRVDRQDWHIRIQTWVVYHVPGWRALEEWAGNPNIVIDFLNQIRFLPPYAGHNLPPSEDRPYYLEPNLKTEYWELAAGWEKFINDVHDMRLDCTKQDIPFAAFCIPEAACIDDGLWKKDVIDAGLADLYDRGKDAARTEQALRAKDIPVISLADTLKEANREKPVYYLLDRHFSPYGAKVVADRLADELLETGLVAKALDAQIAGD